MVGISPFCLYPLSSLVTVPKLTFFLSLNVFALNCIVAPVVTTLSAASVVIVTVPDKSGYGFNVFELSIGDTYELLGDGQYSTYYSFVNDRVETFFAGNR